MDCNFNKKKKRIFASLACILGYNSFNNLVMHNKILRHIHKQKIFRFFEPFPARLQSKFTKSANKSKKNIFIKNSIWVSKNAIFFTFTHVRQTCFAVNFFMHFFTTFSTDSKSA